MAFKIAASLAFKGIVEARSATQEPIMKTRYLVPEKYTGDVMGDMNKKRGHILSMDPADEGTTCLHARSAEAELFDYAIVLRAMTQARVALRWSSQRYEEVPANLRRKRGAQAGETEGK